MGVNKTIFDSINYIAQQNTNIFHYGRINKAARSTKTAINLVILASHHRENRDTQQNEWLQFLVLFLQLLGSLGPHMFL